MRIQVSEGYRETDMTSGLWKVSNREITLLMGWSHDNIPLSYRPGGGEGGGWFLEEYMSLFISTATDTCFNRSLAR